MRLAKNTNIDTLSPKISQFVIVMMGKILEKEAPDLEKQIQYKAWPEIAEILNNALGTSFSKEAPEAVGLIYDLCVAIHNRRA